MTSPSTPSYREIKLTQGQVALVSAHRFEELNAHKWRAQWNPCTRSFYVTRTIRLPDGRRRSLLIHRVILGLTSGDERQGDHVNGDTLDNCDENLRIATKSENQCNRGSTSMNSCGLKGAHWHRSTKKWQAEITINGKLKYLGLFTTAIAAHMAYCEAAKQLHKEFARLK